MSMLSKIKTESETRQAEAKRLQDRKRAILVFIQRHLNDAGYINSCQAVAKDTALSLDSLDVADNIDLDLIFQEFEDYYAMKSRYLFLLTFVLFISKIFYWWCHCTIT